MKLQLPFGAAPTFATILYTFVVVIGNASILRAEPLATARALAASRFDGWTYGSDPVKKQIDCVHFVLAVVEEELKSSLSKEIKDAILINYGWSQTEIQTIIAVGTDAKLEGVHHAIVDIAKRGVSVEPSAAKPGDLIQYWMKDADGRWFGHSGVISSVSPTQLTVFSARKKTDKIDDSLVLPLKKINRIYIVRLK